MKPINCASLVASLGISLGALSMPAVAHETAPALSVAPQAITANVAALGKLKLLPTEQVAGGSSQQQQQQQQHMHPSRATAALTHANAPYAEIGFTV